MAFNINNSIHVVEATCSATPFLVKLWAMLEDSETDLLAWVRSHGAERMLCLALGLGRGGQD